MVDPREQKRLVNKAETMPCNYQNPAPIKDSSTEDYHREFWKHVIINGGGKVSNGDRLALPLLLLFSKD